MGYLISQIVMCLLLAGIVGGIIGYFLKQFWSSNALQQVDTMWSEKVRAVTRNLKASRAETKVYLLKTEDLEQAQLDSVRQLKTAHQQVSTANQKSAHLQTELAGKMVTISAQEGFIRDWKTRLEAEAKKAVERDAALAGKDTEIQNIQDELAAAAKVSGAQDLHVQTLGAQIVDLLPLTAKLEATQKSFTESEQRCKALETAKNGELAGLRARIKDLEPLSAKVKDWESRYGAMLNDKDSSAAKLLASLAALEPLKGKAETTAKENRALSARVRELEASLQQASPNEQALIKSLQSRVADLEPLASKCEVAEANVRKLEGSLRSLQAASLDKESLIDSLKQREAEIEPLEMKLHAAGREVGLLRLRVAELDPLPAKLAGLEASLRQFTSASLENNPLIASLTSGVEKIGPLELKLSAANEEAGSLLLRVQELEPLRARVAELTAAAASLQTQAAEIEPLTVKLHTALEENGQLRMRVLELEPLAAKVRELEAASTGLDTLQQQSSTAMAHVEKDGLINNLRARLADLEPLQHKLHEAVQERKALSLQLTTLQNAQQKTAAEAAGHAELNNNLRARVADLEPLERKLHHASAAAAEQEVLIANLRARAADAEPLEHRLHGASDEMGRLRVRIAELEPVKAEADEVSKENEVLVARQQEHLSRLHRLEASFEPMRAELAGFRNRAHDWEMRYHLSIEEMGKLQARMAEFEGLRQKLHAQEQQLLTWDRRFSSAVDEKDAEILRLGVELSRLRGQLPLFQVDAPIRPKARTRKSAKESTSNSEFDDLKLIFGIGLVLETRLHEYGVKWFKQLAQWSKEDIVAFETHLPEFQNRVERDKWVAGAKEEHFRKYGETL